MILLFSNRKEEEEKKGKVCAGMSNLNVIKGQINRTEEREREKSMAVRFSLLFSLRFYSSSLPRLICRVNAA